MVVLAKAGNSAIIVAILASLYGITSLLMVYFTARTTAIDPTDPTIQLERMTKA
jgi:hypothetical protein